MDALRINLGAIGTSDGQFNNSAFVVFDGVLRVTNNNALGASGSAGGVTVASSYYDHPRTPPHPLRDESSLAAPLLFPNQLYYKDAQMPLMRNWQIIAAVTP